MVQRDRDVTLYQLITAIPSLCLQCWTLSLQEKKARFRVDTGIGAGLRSDPVLVGGGRCSLSVWLSPSCRMAPAHAFIPDVPTLSQHLKPKCVPPSFQKVLDSVQHRDDEFLKENQ